MSGEAQRRAAMDALRAALARLLELGCSDMAEAERAAALRALAHGHLEVIGSMTPTGLDVRFNVVVADARAELFTVDAELRACGPLLN